MHTFPGKFQIWNSFVSTLRESKRHSSTCYAGEPQQTDIEQPWQTKQLMIINYYWLLDWFEDGLLFLQVLWRLVLGALSNLNLNWFVVACWAPTYCDFWKIQYRKVESCCASRDIDLTSGWEKWIALWLSAAAVQAVSALLLVHVLFHFGVDSTCCFLWLDSKGRKPQIYWNWNHTFNHPVAVVWQRCGSGVAVVWALIGCSMAVKGF